MNTTFNDAFPHFFMNPIQILHRLKAAGFTDKQAEAQVEIVTECWKGAESSLATKQDIKELEIILRREIKEIELKHEFKIKELEMRLTIKTGAIVSAVVGFFYILEKFF